MSMQSHPLRRDGLVGRTRPFLMTFAIASAIALYPYRFGSVAWVVGGLLGAIAAYALVLAVPWDRWPRLLSPCTSLLFVAVVGALMAGKGSVDMSLVALLLLPILWNALYGRPWEMAVATAGAAAAILAVAYQFGEITGGSIAQPLLVWTAVCCLITYAIRRLRNDLAQALETRETMIKQSAAFDLAATELYSTLDPDAVVKIGLQAAAHLILPLEESVKEAFFFVVDGATASLIAHYNQEPEDELPETSFATSDIPLLERALSQGTACLFDIDTESMDRRGADVVTSLRITNGVAIGIRAEGINGVLAVTSHDRRPFSTAQGEQLTSFSTIVSLALSRAMQHAAEATTDALTGLANRREFNNRLATMPRDARYVLLSMDVDSLKRVNDKAGHAAGDELLRGVAQALRSSVRGSDIAARTGGDEFCAILHQPTAAQARAVADRVVAAVRMVSVGGMPGSVSVGFATVESGQNPADRLASADAAMYRAKRAGGSRVSEADAAGALRVEPVSRRAVAS